MMSDTLNNSVLFIFWKILGLIYTLRLGLVGLGLSPVSRADPMAMPIVHPQAVMTGSQRPMFFVAKPMAQPMAAPKASPRETPMATRLGDFFLVTGFCMFIRLNWQKDFLVT
jgi:hypothetical protein